MNMPPPLLIIDPKNFDELFVVVMFILASGAWWVIRWSMRQQTKERNQVVEILSSRQDTLIKTQERISEILDNHLNEIGKYMASTNEILRDLKKVADQGDAYMATTAQAIAQIQNRLLDALIVPSSALRTTEISVKGTPKMEESK